MILLLACLGLGPITAVTCYGTNGHVAVEPVTHACCSGDGSSHHANAPLDASPESHSESHKHCQDVPFDITVTTESKEQLLGCLLVQAMILSVNAKEGIAFDVLPDRDASSWGTCSHFYTPLTSTILLL